MKPTTLLNFMRSEANSIFRFGSCKSTNIFLKFFCSNELKISSNFTLPFFSLIIEKPQTLLTIRNRGIFGATHSVLDCLNWFVSNTFWKSLSNSFIIFVALL
ncbi:hypothetical protein CWI37_0394p0020 [Hamiltosporidium tvaerminnensis]|uniref:Uncharacterized protein n=1 Tax=Hamiltosporidium tvaerminnensis TaxID=1176355 RepID=A0A4Q9L7L5_9MICR|nr:hypothetical protein CWI37_0394p0020 [Hamiltosporidium tvaerminnensis]